MYERVAVKERAKHALSAYRGISIGVYVLYSVLVTAIAGISYGFGIIFLAPPLLVGLATFYLAVWRDREPTFTMLFDGFSHYAQTLVGILWMYLWTALWSLLFIIPGIVKGLAYSMTPYLLAEFPDLSPKRALRISIAITNGRKAEIFVMQLSFLGWIFLSGITLGILYVVHVAPYMQLTYAGMYESMLQDAIDCGAVSLADLANAEGGVVV